MSCCGKKRRQWQQSATKREHSAVVQAPVLEQPVEIYYKGAGSVLIKGEQTGYLYLFGAQEPRLKVDSRDANFILADATRFALG